MIGDPEIERKLWTQHEVDAILRAGINFKSYELIEGELVKKAAKGKLHMIAVMKLYNLLNRIFGEGRVLQEGAIRLANPMSEPEPDIVVLREAFEEIVGKAKPEDVLLVVEVSDSTLADDLGAKSVLYARAALNDYWIVDVIGRRVHVFRSPDPRLCIYQNVCDYGDDQTIAPLAAPQVSIKVSDLLPKRV